MAKTNLKDVSFEDLKKLNILLEDEWEKERQEFWNRDWSWYEYCEAVDNSVKYKRFVDCNRELISRYTPEIAIQEGLQRKQINELVFGDVFTHDAFKEMCSTGFVTGNDGIGYYSDGMHEYDISASPNAFYTNTENKNFSHVVWYNK